MSSKKYQKRRNRQNQWIAFELLFAFWIILPLFIIGGFNFLIDPYGVYNQFFTLRELNDYKPNKEDNDRLYKAIDIIHLQPNTILLGSSRVKRGLDPDHPALNDFPPVYNLGLNGANIYEIRRYLEHTLVNNPRLKRVILGLDFFTFDRHIKNQPGFAEYRLEKKQISGQDAINTTFSLDTLASSQETILANFDTPKSDQFSAHKGFLPYFKIHDGNTEIRFQGSTKLFFIEHQNYQLSAKYMEDFKTIVKLCQQNKVELIVFISPSHGIRLQSIYASGKWSVFEEWKRQIVELMGSVWDFSNYNLVNREELSEKMNYYVDDSHYTKPIGDWVLNRILGYQDEEVPPDFGVLLTRDNLDRVLAKNRQDRDQWQQEYPQYVEFVQSIQEDVLNNSPK
jgi:hypothetical protein